MHNKPLTLCKESSLAALFVEGGLKKSATIFKSILLAPDQYKQGGKTLNALPPLVI